jgi:hypothetical protein
MSSDDDDVDGNKQPEIVDEPDDDNSGHYIPSHDEESSDNDSNTAEAPEATLVPTLKIIDSHRDKSRNYKNVQLRTPPKLRARQIILARPVKGGYIKSKKT